MPKKIEIILLKRNIRAVAEMHEDLAPKTCKAIWNVLPHEGDATHARMTGNEIWTAAGPTKELKEVPRENLTIYPRPGDLMYAYLPPAWEGGMRGLRKGVCDIAIFYGADSPIYQYYGPFPMNHFGTIIENLDRFAEQCETLLIEGRQKIAIRKL